jgi:hypothetical protein
MRRIGVLGSLDENDPDEKLRLSAFTQALGCTPFVALRTKAKSWFGGVIVARVIVSMSEGNSRAGRHSGWPYSATYAP